MIARALTFSSRDQRFGLSIDEPIMDMILKLCRKAANFEIGGILVGNYSKQRDWAIVTDVSGPPEDSKRARTSFSRGVKGLQKWLNHLWGSKRHYYLGEWHYHPFASPEASSVDAKQLKEYSEDGPLLCPEPVMLIVGGNPNGSWETRAYIYPKGKGLCCMNELDPMESFELPNPEE